MDQNGTCARAAASGYHARWRLGAPLALTLALLAGCASESPPIVTLAEACGGDLESLEGRSIDFIVAGVGTRSAGCTAAACGEDTCCNQCSSAYVLPCNDRTIVLEREDTYFGCSGTECSETCVDGIDPSQSLRVRGRIELSPTYTPGCCTPIIFTLADADAWLVVDSFEVVSDD